MATRLQIIGTFIGRSWVVFVVLVVIAVLLCIFLIVRFVGFGLLLVTTAAGAGPAAVSGCLLSLLTDKISWRPAGTSWTRSGSDSEHTVISVSVAASYFRFGVGGRLGGSGLVRPLLGMFVPAQPFALG
mgnify:CR=1 FL=1